MNHLVIGALYGLGGLGCAYLSIRTGQLLPLVGVVATAIACYVHFSHWKDDQLDIEEKKRL